MSQQNHLSDRSAPLVAKKTIESKLQRWNTDGSSTLGNRLLSLIPATEWAAIEGKFDKMHLRRRQVLIEPNLPVTHAYFPITGTASFLSRGSGEKPMETSIVGKHGFIGIPIILGTNRSPLRCSVQMSGTAFRIAAADLTIAFAEQPQFRRNLLFHIQARMTQQSVLIACNARHTLEQRVCRWLLMALARLESRTIPATHDLVARMLGVRRAGVTQMLARLEQQGVLLRSRGRIDITSPEELERTSCDCFRIIQNEYDRLLTDRDVAR